MSIGQESQERGRSGSDAHFLTQSEGTAGSHPSRKRLAFSRSSSLIDPSMNQSLGQGWNGSSHVPTPGRNRGGLSPLEGGGGWI